jgi:alpha,alpha-trehalase
VHYPGTYLAGVYNRLGSTIDGTVLHDESLINIPNWLLVTLHHADGTPLDADHGTLQAYRQELDMRRGLLTRSFVHEDTAGRPSASPSAASFRKPLATWPPWKPRSRR